MKDLDDSPMGLSPFIKSFVFSLYWFYFDF